jgi:hypothetical protein
LRLVGLPDPDDLEGADDLDPPLEDLIELPELPLELDLE